MRAVNVSNVAIGDQFICAVSNCEPDAIPGQKPGERYYLRVLSIRKTRWYAHFECAIENKHKLNIGTTCTITHRRDERTMVV
jgi:hypothetical protein